MIYTFPYWGYETTPFLGTEDIKEYSTNNQFHYAFFETKEVGWKCSYEYNCYFYPQFEMVTLFPGDSLCSMPWRGAILMVVYTHVLRYVGIGCYLDNPFFKFTYAFHMSLFMTVSGYFSVSSLQMTLPGLLKKKTIALLLPCFAFCSDTFGFISLYFHIPV